MNRLKVLLLTALLVPPLAHATLGESATASVPRDHQKMSARNIQTATHKNFQVHVFTVHAVTIKEFVGSDGKIFAVSWRGLTNPDLRTLFGNYFSEYQTANAKIPKGRRFVRQPVVTDNILVVHDGHFPHLRGQAYLKGKIPTGWNMDDLL